MTFPTYTNVNNNSDPITTNSIDSTVSSAPTDRPSTFTPTTGYPTVTATQDHGIGSTPKRRPQIFEGVSFSAAIDPGLITPNTAIAPDRLFNY